MIKYINNTYRQKQKFANVITKKILKNTYIVLIKKNSISNSISNFKL